MARFPETESDVAALATVMIEGFRSNAEQFPTPPVPPDALQAALDAYNEAKTAAVAAEAAARDRIATKNDALEQLADHMRLVLTYAEVTAKDAPDQLAKIGWAPRRDPRKPELPGIVRDLAVKSQGVDWFVLDWKAPNDGGTPGAYHIERRRRDGGEWEEIAHAIASEELLTGQEPAVEWEFRVWAENRAGEGDRSTVLAVEL
jgi:Fibronectin type III domain